MVVVISCKLSVEGPQGLLRLDLTLQSPRQPNDQKLTESDADGNTSHSVEVVVNQSLQNIIINITLLSLSQSTSMVSIQPLVLILVITSVSSLP